MTEVNVLASHSRFDISDDVVVDDDEDEDEDDEDEDDEDEDDDDDDEGDEDEDDEDEDEDDDDDDHTADPKLPKNRRICFPSRTVTFNCLSLISNSPPLSNRLMND